MGRVADSAVINALTDPGATPFKVMRRGGAGQGQRAILDNKTKDRLTKEFKLIQERVRKLRAQSRDRRIPSPVTRDAGQDEGAGP